MRKILQRQRWDREVAAERDFCARIGKPYVEKDYHEVEVKTTPVEIEYEELHNFTASEDENEAEGLDTRSRRSLNTVKGMSDLKYSQKTESPELFRLRARLRMMSSMKKFTLGV